MFDKDPKKVLCDAYGSLKPKQTEIAVLLNSNSPSALPSEDVVTGCLESIPSPEGMARLALNRWSRSTDLAGHQEILNAFIKLHGTGGVTAAGNSAAPHA